MVVGVNPPEWFMITFAIICSFSSSIFSGLTLSLMSLDVVQLKVLTYATSNDPVQIKNAERAKKILPLRKDGYLLLSTLIVGNVMSNVALSILLGGLLDKFLGFIVSTIITTILGEIIPQAVFIKHSLYFGSLFAPLTSFLILILYPITKPISLLLEYFLGNIQGVVYSKKELKALFDVQRSEGNVLSDEECIMLKGCLDIANVKAKNLMTPLHKVFALSVTTKFTPYLVKAITKSGFSKIPIVDYSNESCVIGMLYSRDLIKVQASYNLTCGEVLLKFGKTIYALDEDAGLISILSYFHYGNSDFAVVRRVVNMYDKDPYYKHIGIITLKSIITKIIQVDLKTSQYFTHELIIESDSNEFISFDNQLISMICNEFSPYVKYKVESILKNIIANKLSVKQYRANSIICGSNQDVSGVLVMLEGSITMSTPNGSLVKRSPCIIYEHMEMISLASILHNPIPENLIAITMEELEKNLGIELVSLYDIVANENTTIHMLRYEESIQILSLLKQN